MTAGREGFRSPPDRIDPPSSPVTVYVVVEGTWGTGDVAGASVTADRVWFSHISSSPGWLMRDTTDGFTDRREQLEAAYPDGYRVVLVDRHHPLPDEIAHHYNQAEATTPDTPPEADRPEATDSVV